jgi:putative methionine-R-sulfoxide reductase with GAF domain
MDDYPTRNWSLRDPGDPVALDRMAEEALRLLPAAEGAVVQFVDGDGLVFVGAAGTLASYLGLRVRLDESLTGLAVLTGSRLRCDDAHADPWVDRNAARLMGAVSVASVPLTRDQYRLGAISVTSSSCAAFDDRDVSILSELADRVATPDRERAESFG